jgi:hypothetical protein
MSYQGTLPVFECDCCGKIDTGSENEFELIEVPEGWNKVYIYPYSGSRFYLTNQRHFCSTECKEKWLRDNKDHISDVKEE